MMRKDTRLIVALAALLLLPALQLPLWSIRLVAPQYREGLGLYIGARDIWGHTEHDIQNINILNHYIGMKPIVPAEVDVLTIMPWALGLLVVTGLVVAVLGRRGLVGGWLLLFAALGLAGLYEFWSWNYDYGHNLSPDAPIKVPGMTYQPPLIGTTTLLTIRASSFPSWGTLFVALSFATALFAFVRERPQFGRRRARRSRPKTPAPQAGRAAAEAGSHRTRRLSPVALGVLLLVLGACAPAAQEDAARGDATAAAVAWAHGGAASDYCDGVIPERRYGGELVTDERTYRFMSTECLAGFVLSGQVADHEIRALRVVDFNHGERLIDARTAYYVRTQFERSPNGLNVVATDRDKVAANIHYFLGGQRMTWAEVLALVAREWAPTDG
jgi:copper chaperone NosL